MYITIIVTDLGLITILLTYYIFQKEAKQRAQEPKSSCKFLFDERMTSASMAFNRLKYMHGFVKVMGTAIPHPNFPGHLTDSQ